MWLLSHRNVKTQPLRDGDSFVETCPECGRRATFLEVEVTEGLGVFFVDLVDDKERAYRCGACGEVFDLKDQPQAGAPPRPAQPGKSLAELELDREIAAQRRREAVRARAVRIEDEQADLKKRMGS